jgi:Flp pilus assembly pilin Flp
MIGLISRKSKSRAGSVFRCRKLRDFGKREDGAAAVEFAMVLAPFLAMLFAIFETAMVFFAGQTLETAAADSARLILTGQAQTQSLNQASFKEAVCARVYGLFDCSDGMTVDGLVKAGVYNPGGPCEIVVVRLIYQFPVYVSLLGFNLADMAGNKRLLVATSVFRNEPYQGTCSS